MLVDGKGFLEDFPVPAKPPAWLTEDDLAYFVGEFR